MTRKRHRKSYNPFRFQGPVGRPDWPSVLDLTKPIAVDLGFGRGEFILEMARRQPEVQFIGVEIREYLVSKMQALLAVGPVPNVFVIMANVKEHLAALFDPGMLSRAYIHFPDPWTQRKRHHKRRMVDERLVNTLYTLLKPGGEVHLMTDKEAVGIEMRELFEAHGGYSNACGQGQFCPESTTGVQTREEMYYLEQGTSIYRLRFVRGDGLPERPLPAA
jgi:tRNA (guanine-N7-)-methyltransferase